MSNDPKPFDVPPGYDPPASRPNGKTLLMAVGIVIACIAIAVFRSM